MIDRTARLSVGRQAKVLGISRGSVYYKPRPVSDADLKLMHRIDKLHMEFPFAGSRMLQGLLVQEGFKVGRLHVATVMKRMGIEALYRKPNTSKPAPGHKIYPYLLRKLPIIRPNQVWAMDITYIPMARGFIYLAAVLDWFSRRILAWRVSITLEVDFCIEAVEEALARHGTPEIFNMEHGRAIGSSGHATSGQPVHVHRLHQGAGRPRDQDQHGWQGSLARQRLRRAPLANHQIRRGLPARLCQRFGSPRRDRSLSRLLQQPPSTFIP
jgi:transposase InsO family protein